jgi:hypothetical protein
VLTTQFDFGPEALIQHWEILTRGTQSDHF